MTVPDVQFGRNDVAVPQLEEDVLQGGVRTGRNVVRSVFYHELQTMAEHDLLDEVA